MATSRNSEGVPAQPIGERCLSFTVSADWGHFRRIEGNIVKQTYRIAPRTTIAGLIAAMLGLGRDTYYDLFAPSESAVAIEPRSSLRTINMPINALSTAGNDVQMHPTRGNARIGLVDPDRLRQQHNYEFLVEPAYRMDVWLDDAEVYSDLRTSLEEGKSHYTPSLGLSECLARIDYHGEEIIENADESGGIAVDSAVVESVDAIEPSPGHQVRIERSPGYMEYDGEGRRTTGFISYAFSQEGDSLSVEDVPACRVDDRTVMFS